MLDIIWDETYSVHIAKIDQQHQKFTVMLDMLFEAIEAGRSQDALYEILQELIAYAGYHFDTEEELMVQYQYPEFEAHHQEHETFRAKVLEFQENFLGGGETVAIDVAHFMTHWIAEHVMNTDKKYSPFLNAKGVY